MSIIMSTTTAAFKHASEHRVGLLANYRTSSRREDLSANVQADPVVFKPIFSLVKTLEKLKLRKDTVC